MQPLEIALKKVFDFIGDDYVLPTGEFINDDFGNNSQIRNPFYGQTPSKLKFMFGTQKELNIWLATTTDKYPLVWLVYPVTESYNNNPQSFYTYKGIRLIFAINSDAEKLVQIRLQTTKFILNQLIDRFTELMRNSRFKRFILIDKQVDVKEKFFPNYSTNEQKTSGTVEIWDAITFDCDLHLLPNCIK